MYETTINPGIGLGSFLKLGSSLYSVSNALMKFNYKLRIGYSDKDFLNLSIIVEVVDVGIRLTFLNHHHQALNLIELMHLNDSKSKPIKLIYNDINLNELDTNESNEFKKSDEMKKLNEVDNRRLFTDLDGKRTSLDQLSSFLFTGPTLKSIYNKIFGPTYPGDLYDHVYIITYPGISFKFKLSSEIYDKVRHLQKQAIILYLLNLDQDIICDSIAIHKGDSWNDFKNSDRNLCENHEPINRLSINLDVGEIIVNFNDSSTKKLIIGKTSQQQTLNILGPPDNYFNKFDSRLLIHKHTNIKYDNEISQYKFHNYFKYGFDILYDLNDESNLVQNKTTIKKVIIHNGGIPESLNFMKWNRCNWEIYNKLVNFNSSMVYDNLPSYLKSLSPVILNRNESEFVDNDLDIIDYPKVNQESVASTNPMEQKIKTWGQSKLYGFDHCIFEILDSNGTISTITVY